MSLRDEIAEKINNMEDTNVILDFIDAEHSKRPSGLVAVKECDVYEKYGYPMVRHCLMLKGDIHPITCACHGSGTITRDVTVEEALEIPKMLLEGKIVLDCGASGVPINDMPEVVMFFKLPSGERIVKRNLPA